MATDFIMCTLTVVYVLCARSSLEAMVYRNCIYKQLICGVSLYTDPSPVLCILYTVSILCSSLIHITAERSSPYKACTVASRQSL